MTNVINFDNAKLWDTNDPPPRGPQTKPIVQLETGRLPEACNEIEQHLKNNNPGLYRHGSTLVHVVWDSIKVSGGNEELAPRNHLVTPPKLLEDFSLVAHFEKWDERKGDYRLCNPPTNLAEMFLARGEWDLPSLLGIVTAPTIRSDGTIITDKGYDQQTGLIYDPCGVIFPPIPKKITKQDARKALDMLLKPLRLYKFEDDANRSVALSAVLTSVVRKALKAAPLHVFDAPAPGSGKSNLVDYASVIATGHAAPVTTTMGESKESVQELEKRLYSSLLSGDTIISLDNINHQLDSAVLCSMLTQPTIKIRQFGRLQNIVVPSTATFFANGNNIRIVDDLNRRTLKCRVDPREERPELIKYPFHPVNLARRARPLLVTAALTVVCGYLQQKEKLKISPLGSYEQWSRFVREPLIWLGEVDPVEVQEKTRESDPTLERLSRFLAACIEVIGLDKPFQTKDIIRKANEREQEHDQLLNLDLYEAVHSVATSNNGRLSPDRLGWYLRKNMGRSITISRDLVKILQEKSTTQGAQWVIASAHYVPPDEKLSFC